MSLRYPHSARIRRRADFRHVVGDGDVFPGREVVVRRIPSPAGEARLGISAPRRYGRAVQRNRLRRLVREAFRSIRARLGAYDYFVSPRRHLREPTLAGIRADLLSSTTRRPAPRQPRAPS